MPLRPRRPSDCIYTPKQPWPCISKSFAFKTSVGEVRGILGLDYCTQLTSSSSSSSSSFRLLPRPSKPTPWRTVIVFSYKRRRSLDRASGEDLSVASSRDGAAYGVTRSSERGDAEDEYVGLWRGGSGRIDVMAVGV